MTSKAAGRPFLTADLPGDIDYSPKMKPTPEQSQLIDERLNRLVDLSKDAGERLNYLFLTNAGGAAATLRFLRAVPSMRRPALEVALACFVVGLILAVVHSAIWIRHTNWLVTRFRSDVTEFYQNKITWDKMITVDAGRADQSILLYVSGYLTFGFFVIGAAIEFLSSSF